MTPEPDLSRRSPLHGRYLASNPRLLAFLSASDAILGAFRRTHSTPIPRAPKRVLLALGGHLGDAVIATATIEYLHHALPGTRFGIVLPSWSRIVLEGDPRLRWIHTVDHWKSNRTSASRLARWRRYRATRREALREIRDVHYDAALDLYGYFPNMALLLSRSGIPVRLGFTSGGFGPLYTHASPWTDDLRHVAQRQVELAATLAGDPELPAVSRYSLLAAERDHRAGERVDALLRKQQLVKGAYVVLHAGTGAVEREWPAAQWRELSARLVAEGLQLVFTGRGERENALIHEVAEGIPGVLSLGDQLDWPEFVQVIRGARLVITVETAAAHVAAAVGTPCLAIWSGITSSRHWGPLGKRTILLTHPVPCGPCFRNYGCEAMTCVRSVSPDGVMTAVHSLFGEQARVDRDAVRDQPVPVAR